MKWPVPQVGEVWRVVGMMATRTVEELYLVIGEHVHLRGDEGGEVRYEQRVLLDLTSGKLRRVNVGLLHPGNGWNQWLS